MTNACLAQIGGCTKVCRPLPFLRPPVYSPPLQPPSRRTHPVSAPSPFSCKRGCKRGSALPPPALARSPALPCLAPPSALPCPSCPPLCAHAGGAKGTVRHPTSFPFAGSSPICPGCTPPRLHALRSPLRPGCTPPCLHVLARWGQGGQSVPHPFLFPSRPLRLGCSLSRPAYAPPATRAPSPTLYANAG